MFNLECQKLFSKRKEPKKTGKRHFRDCPHGEIRQTYPGPVALMFRILSWRQIKTYSAMWNRFDSREKLVKSLLLWRKKRNLKKKDLTYPCCIKVPMANQKLFGKVKSFWNTRPAVSSHGSGLAHSYGENLATIQIVIETKM